MCCARLTNAGLVGGGPDVELHLVCTSTHTWHTLAVCQEFLAAWHFHDEQLSGRCVCAGEDDQNNHGIQCCKWWPG